MHSIPDVLNIVILINDDRLHGCFVGLNFKTKSEGSGDVWLKIPVGEAFGVSKERPNTETRQAQGWCIGGILWKCAQS